MAFKADCNFFFVTVSHTVLFKLTTYLLIFLFLPTIESHQIIGLFFANFAKGILNLLLYLKATIGAGHTDDKSQFLSGEVDVLAFEGPLFGLISPCESFIHVHQSIHCPTYGYNSPPSRLGHLNTQGSQAGMLL